MLLLLLLLVVVARLVVEVGGPRRPWLHDGVDVPAAREDAGAEATAWCVCVCVRKCVCIYKCVCDGMR